MRERMERPVFEARDGIVVAVGAVYRQNTADANGE
jgi:hypothetical protein